MKLIRGIDKLQRKFKRPVLTVGMFDGVHLGHQRIIKKVVRRGRALKGTSVVLTFMSHPLRIFQSRPDVALICPLEHRLDLLRALGVNVCLLVDFNRRFSRITAQDFIKRIVAETLGVNCLIVGKGFRFGKDKKGDFALLRRLSKIYGLKARRVNPVRINGRIISSSTIRALIQKGKIGRANKMLGRHFSISGKVKPGSARGRLLGYPTANIEAEQEILPLSGVYAVFVKLEHRILPGILNIGCRPTFFNRSGSSNIIEAHIFNFRSKIYGKALEVFFVRRIRSERKFASRRALLAQIKKDEIKAKAILRSKHPASV